VLFFAPAGHNLAAMLRPGKTIGKYRIQRRLGTGGFATVYRALDTVEGIHVALKIPHPNFLRPESLGDFRREIRIAARLDHPNILPIKNAEVYDGHLVVAYPLGTGTLDDRLRKRISTAKCLLFAEQILEALAYAHWRRIVHCDVKPENFILFPDDVLRLTDFGIAKVVLRTRSASGSGTIGYVAPEQAMGRPSFRSDVFSAGLVLYRMFSGYLPGWPFRRPFPGSATLRRKVPSVFVDVLHRALHVNDRRRFADAGRMLEAFERTLPAVERFQKRARSRRRRRR